jgi:hypothetical protein
MSPDAIVLVSDGEDISFETLTGKQQVQLLVVVLPLIRFKLKKIESRDIPPEILGTSKLLLAISPYKRGLAALEKPVGSLAGFA